MTNHEKVALYFPESYHGMIETLEGSEMSVIEAANYVDVLPIFKRFGVWSITPYGIECLLHNYPIGKERFDELDWVEHMSEKTWINIKDFEQALFAAKDMLELGII